MTPNDHLTTQINAELRPLTAGEEVAAQVGVVAVRALSTAASAARDVFVGTIRVANSFASNPEVQAVAVSALSAAAGGAKAVVGTAAAAITGTVQTLRDPVVQAAVQRLVAEGGRRISDAASGVAHGAADLAILSRNYIAGAAAVTGQGLLTAPPDGDDEEFMYCEQDVNGETQLRPVSVPAAPPTTAAAAATPVERPEAETPISTAITDSGEHYAADDILDAVSPASVTAEPDSLIASDREQPSSALLEQTFADDRAVDENSDDGVISVGPDSPRGSKIGSPVTIMYGGVTAAAGVVGSAEHISAIPASTAVAAAQPAAIAL